MRPSDQRGVREQDGTDALAYYRIIYTSCVFVGSTSIVRMSKGAISGVSDSIHPSIPNFAAAYAMSTPRPRPAPVISHTFFSSMAWSSGSLLRSTLAEPSRR